jgi:type II secretory pathway pseudopilin PulG
MNIEGTLVAVLIAAVLGGLVIGVGLEVYDQAQDAKLQMIGEQVQQQLEITMIEEGQYPIVEQNTDITLLEDFNVDMELQRLQDDIKIYYKGDAENYSFTIEWGDNKLDFNNNE